MDVENDGKTIDYNDQCSVHFAFYREFQYGYNDHVMYGVDIKNNNHGIFLFFIRDFRYVVNRTATSEFPVPPY